jgi:hypothetical protein
MRHPPAPLRASAARDRRPRQIEPAGNGQAGVVVGQRQRHRDLAVVLLAQLAALLPRDAHRVLALLSTTVAFFWHDVSSGRVWRGLGGRGARATKRRSWRDRVGEGLGGCAREGGATPAR